MGLFISKKQRIIGAYARRIVDLEDVLAELYSVVIEDIDPEPRPIQAYLPGNVRLQDAAAQALTLGDIRRGGRRVRTPITPIPSPQDDG